MKKTRILHLSSFILHPSWPDQVAKHACVDFAIFDGGCGKARAGGCWYAKTQAEEILEEAQREAVGIRESARIDGAAHGKQEGLVAGVEEGKKAGHLQALNENRTQLTSLVKALTAAVTDIDAHRRKIKADAVEDIINLAIAISTRVTKQRGAEDPSIAKDNVVEAMKLVTHAGDVRIGVHPQQRATLERELPAAARCNGLACRTCRTG